MVARIPEEIAMSELYVRWLPFAAPVLALLCLAVSAPHGARAADGGADASAEPILEAAQRFLETLSPEQRERAVMPFDDERREDWHFIPKPQRKGLALKDMTPEQMHMAHVLLSASLSQRGYAKATTIMSLDALLKQIEQEAGFTQMLSLRDPLFYYVTIFGEPAAGAEWGWSLEGHHVSVNFTLVGESRGVEPDLPRLQSACRSARAARRPADPRARGGPRPRVGGVARRRAARQGDPHRRGAERHRDRGRAHRPPRRAAQGTCRRRQ